jgi:hypothetical protein
MNFGACIVQPKATAAPAPKKPTQPKVPPGKVFHYDDSLDAFLFDVSKETPCFVEHQHGNADTDILIPFDPCIYRIKSQWKYDAAI